MTLPGVSYDKIKAVVFDATQIKKLVKCQNFSISMTDVKQRAWIAVKWVLGNSKVAKYKRLVERLLDSFYALSISISIKVHLLMCQFNRFPAKFGDENDAQNINAMEERYEARLNRHMMVDYRWSIQRDCVDMEHSRLCQKRKSVLYMCDSCTIELALSVMFEN